MSGVLREAFDPYRTEKHAVNSYWAVCKVCRVNDFKSRTNWDGQMVTVCVNGHGLPYGRISQVLG